MADVSELVQLNLIAPSHVDPMPDKGNFGKFDKVLRSVGSPRSVHVRPRMITVVAETKYVTRSGLPVSLVGLHGKDELLVVGPVWALTKLASGQKPAESTLENSHVAYQRALRTIVEEAFWLLRVCTLLAVSNGEPWRPCILSHVATDSPLEGETYFQTDPLWPVMENDLAAHESSISFVQFAATELLQGMFRCPVGAIQTYFETIVASEFIQQCLKECVEKHQAMIVEAEERSDIHSMWWGDWEEKSNRYVSMPNFLTSAGRNITAYPTRAESLSDAKPRRYSMHEKWKTTIAKFHASNGAE